MKKYVLLLLIIIGFSINWIQQSSASNEFWPVWTTFIWMHWHTYHVVQSWTEIKLQCENWASKCLENCGSNPPEDPPYDPPPTEEPCSCEDWSSYRSSCNADTYTWSNDTVLCVNKRTCVQNLIWTSTTKNWTKTCDDWSCGACSVSCNWRWADDSRTTVVEIPYDCTPMCWDASRSYTYNDTAWPTWTTFCAWEQESDPISPEFPDIGWSTSWTCSNWSTWTWCVATRTWIIYPVCWNWHIDAGEDCDDGDQDNYNSCNNNCEIPWSWGSECWDWTQDANEACDDWNTLSWDWCSSTCTIEGDIEGWRCWDWEVQKPNSFWVIEACDDANFNNNDECTNSCMLRPEWDPDDKTWCWNWIVENPNYFWLFEACDDWNLNNNDDCTNNCIENHESQPGELNITATTTCDNTLWWSGYADNEAINSIYATITVPTWVLEDRDIIGLWTPSDFVDLSNNLSDRVYQTWISSLHFVGEEINWDPSKWNTQKVKIATVTSVTPFRSCWNKLSFKLWWKTIVLNDVGYNFKKPFIWELTSDWDISLWTKLSYKLTALPQLTGFSNYAIWLKVNNISFLWDNITLQNTTLKPYPTGTGPREFETRINSSNYATRLNEQPGLQVILPVISYTLDDQIVRYYLSAYDYGNDRTPIKLVWDRFIWIKVIWGLQWDWKYEFTWQWENISNLYPSDLRTEIRKRAYDYISFMDSWEILNNVKYVNWDITISWDQNYETLVVKDWNVIISGSLNPSDKKLWIIVLKDNYDTNNWFNYKWNVFVDKDVTNINAIIYADGWFISANGNGNPYTTDTTTRTYALQKQLTMKGILFTRNTIWWAQYVWWYYTLPGWTRTLSFDKAMVYDLNYIRRWNQWCDDNSTPADWDCYDSELWEIKEWFIIKYDSRIQTSPPKLFSK